MLRPLFYLLLASASSLTGADTPTSTPVPSAAVLAVKTTAETSGLIHIGGSDLLQTAVGEPLMRYAKQFHLDVIVDLQGSTPALDNLKSGKMQLAIIAAPVGQNPAPPGFKAIPFCFTADYIIVNSTNPLTALNLRQVAGIFGAVKESIGSWNQLKLAGEWADRPIVPYSTSRDDGVVIEMLKFIALEQKDLRSSVHVLNTPDEVFSAVKNSPAAIGLCGYDPGAPFKVLLLSPDKSAGAGTSQAAAPSPENIASGEYPLRLPFYLVYNPANKMALLPYLRLVLSDAYATRLREAHFIPLTDADRNRALLGLDKPD